MTDKKSIKTTESGQMQREAEREIFLRPEGRSWLSVIAITSRKIL